MLLPKESISLSAGDDAATVKQVADIATVYVVMAW